jgi:hypothetical protein
LLFFLLVFLRLLFPLSPITTLTLPPTLDPRELELELDGREKHKESILADNGVGTKKRQADRHDNANTIDRRNMKEKTEDVKTQERSGPREMEKPSHVHFGLIKRKRSAL